MIMEVVNGDGIFRPISIFGGIWQEPRNNAWLRGVGRLALLHTTHCDNHSFGQRSHLPSVTMSDDFLRLVSQANPAARQQYQPANNGYPPSGTAGPYSDRSQQLIDPFFDDEEDNVPDSAFGRPAPMHSQESGLPLTRSAAPPAGFNTPSSNGLPQGWNFDDDDFHSSTSQNFPGPPKATQPKSSSSALSRLKAKKWKWPWEKEKVLTGERVVALNNSAANAEFCSNFVSTSKYNLATFLPKFLYGLSVKFCTLYLFA